ncbi:alpha/beta fold hydrolase [Nocardioides nematodiphilus]|uniref:alpha/beta fold hydrolase n=1 Tax=Nocardioides nematodiphilus TaxID=2849669 RepID=UPI001CDA2E9C|nr:alpha/beta hydrolase [Nocardioides nematodiphilus]MCA1983087.1 alpha/beta hydrolase [Nocardioides nematodiphilus]
MSDQITFWQAIADLPHTLEYVQVGPWRTRVLTVGGTGEPDEETIVLLNGTTGHIEAFTQNIHALASRCRVIGYDYPGHGFTTLTDHDLEIPEYEEHLLGLLDVLGLERPHLCGESLGGWIAIKFAAHHPDRVRTLILSAPGGRVTDEARVDRAQSVSRQAVAEPTYENVKQRLQVVIHDPEKITDELVRIRQAVYSREGFGASMRHIAVLREAETRYRNRVTDEDYAAIPVPALLVWTDHEPSGGPDLGERLAGLIPDGEYLLVKDAAHWPQWEDPKTFNRNALDFLARKA